MTLNSSYDSLTEDSLIQKYEILCDWNYSWILSPQKLEIMAASAHSAALIEEFSMDRFIADVCSAEVILLNKELNLDAFII